MRSPDAGALSPELKQAVAEFAASLIDSLTEPGERECVFCYVYRMIGRGCDTTLRWAMRWRDLRAPKARGLERQLQARGGFCDCEIFMNGWEPANMVVDADGNQEYPEHLPPCPGVLAGSTQPCALWAPRPRYGSFW